MQRDVQPGIAVADRAADGGPGRGRILLVPCCDLATLRWAVPILRLFFPAAAYQQAPLLAGPLAPLNVCAAAGRPRTFRPEWMRMAVRERLGCEPVEIDSGHCPHVSQPKTIAEILDQQR
jgi:hypothetical protein